MDLLLGLEKDENFRANTKIGESYTRFVAAYDQIINNENEVDWKVELKRWIVSVRKNESISVEGDLSGWNEEEQRINYLYTFKNMSGNFRLRYGYILM
ncbi:MAG TPA: hypothetical protein VH500_17960 [Nitrososphaeraceae archaeon]|jgi:uncharacterized protein affecting Mg2+/Co2+ transport